MKSFTAKEFSRCPAKVYEAAREDGIVEITHDRFEGKFMLCKVNAKRYEFDSVVSSHCALNAQMNRNIMGRFYVDKVTEHGVFTGHDENKKATD